MNIKKAIRKLPLLTFVCMIFFNCLVPLVSAQTDFFKALETPFYDPSASSGDSCSLGDSPISSTLPATVPEPHATLFTQASAAFKINPQFLAAIFLSENGNVWKPFDTAWATSPVGASGPFQFMPGTWDGYKTDGDNDGKTDINNIYDAAYSAAKMISGGTGVNTPLGSLDAPFKPNTLLYFAAVYNWGGGNVQIHTTPTSPISAAPTETQNYLKNISALITSGFTKSGNPNYSDPVVPGNVASGGSSSPNPSCSGGVVAGSVIQTALNLSWPAPHDPPLDPKPEYIAALAKYNSSVAGNGADCGVFVATVMHASGADPDYPASGTSVQEAYVESHPAKYQVIQLSASDDTSVFQPGDILIVNAGSGQGADGHTMIFVGSQPGGYNEASASLDSRMPSLGTVSSVADPLGRGYYVLARLK